MKIQWCGLFFLIIDIARAITGNKMVETTGREEAGRQVTVAMLARYVGVSRVAVYAALNPDKKTTVGISEKTVQVHRGSAYRKLDLHNAAEIARLLLRSGDPL